MNNYHTLAFGTLLALAGAGTSSCIKAPDYPVEPSIDFNNVKLIRVPNANGGNTEIDTLAFTINYRDGDGDLGLDQPDIGMAPYNATTGGHNNQGYQKNFYLQPYKKSGTNGPFVKLITPGVPLGSKDGRFPRLDTGTDGKPAPLKGTITYKLSVTLDDNNFSAGDVLKFDISIMDRALHESNTVTTSEVTLGQ